MAFGAEMRDFVSGFKTGYDMFKSPQERAEHDEDRDWKRQDRETRENERQYQHGLDSKAQENRDWLRNHQQYREGVEDEHWNTNQANTNRRMDQEDRRQKQEEKNQNWREKYQLNKIADPNGTGDNADDMNDFITRDQAGQTAPSVAPPPAEAPGSDGSDTSSDEQSMAIPDYSGSGGKAPMQLASYTPSGGVTSQGNSGSGRDLSYFSREDMSGPEIATRMVGDLQKDYGMPQYVAQGITGALAAETGGFSKMQEEHPLVPGSKGGYGYAQWTGPRRDQFMSYSDGSPNAYGANYGFLTHELDGTESAVLEKLKGARNAEEAQRIFTDNFLRPGIPNREGRSDWTRKVGNVIGAPGGNAINAAVGGLVSAIPDDQEEQNATPPENPPVPTPRPDQPSDQPDESQSAIPENVPTPTPRPDYNGTSDDEDDKPTNDPYEQGRRAVREGLKQALARTGANQQSAIDDPELDKARENYLRGYGAAPRQMMRQVIDKIDPDKQMDPGERNVKAMGMVYRYFQEKGEPDKAKEAAADMLQYYRQQSQQFLALSQAAAQHGDYDKAAIAAQAAYTNIPNGRDLKITKDGDNFLIEVTDAENGEHVTKKVVSPQEFAAQAMHFNPSTFDDEILNAAGAKADTYKQASLADRKTIGDDVRQTASDMAEQGGETNPERTNVVGDIGQDIAGIQQNGMDANQATRFAHKLATMDQAHSASDSGYVVKEVRGNPDLVKVTADGQTVVMSKNALAGLGNLRKDVTKENADDAATAKAKAERNARIVGNISKGIDAFRTGFQQRTDAMQSGAPSTGDLGSQIGRMAPPSGEVSAIPEGVAPVDSGPQDSGQGVGSDKERFDTVQKLLADKQTLMQNTSARAKEMVQRIDDQLRSLGYDVK